MFNIMASSTRSKDGILEIRSEGLRKKWNHGTFKITSTYLLYFKDAIMSKPTGMVLLNSITRVEPNTTSMKDASFAFEVHYKNTKTSPGSPWVLNASSREERIDWMEAIKPESAHFLKQRLNSSLEKRNTVPGILTHPDVADRRVSEPTLTTGNEMPRQPHTMDSRHVPGPIRKQPPSVSTLPQDYIEPSSFSHLREEPDGRNVVNPMQSLPPGFMLKANNSGRKNNSNSCRLPTGHSKLQFKSSLDDQCPIIEDNDQYVLMDDLPGGKLPPTGKPVPKPRKKITPESPPSILRDNGTTPTPDSWLADTNYLSIIDDRVPTAAPPQPSVKDPVTHHADIAENLVKNFSKEQLGELINMLQQVHTRPQSDEEIQEAWSIPSVTSPTSSETKPSKLEMNSELSLRGNVTRLLSHTPELSSQKMLVTADDDDEQYIPRPEWAKAVRHTAPQPLPREYDEQQLDTLSALQEEALNILREDLLVKEEVGEGQFGKVFKGDLKRGAETILVAIKTTKKSVLAKQEEAFLKEINVMSQLMHPNIIRLFGVVRKGVPSPWIVLEYLEYGDLKLFLSKHKRPLSKLVKYMIDVSMGMHYLSEKGLVHRDLAARNVLVNEHETCKVADFGLLREVPKDDSFYHMQTDVPCPVRWMPPESFAEKKFSSASDVWSFGILLWEMFNPKKTPYEKFGNVEVAAKVMKGYRLPSPRSCPPIVARIMKACWHETADKRPSFLLISTLLTTTHLPPDIETQTP